MANAWRRFAAAYRLELRFLCFHWSYPVLHLLWLWFLLTLRREATLGTAQSALNGALGTAAIGLVSVVAIFVAGASATRSVRTRFAALEGAFPAGAEVLVGRWLAGLTGLMGAMVTPLVLAALQGPAASFRAALPGFLARAAIALAFATAFTWWLVDWLGPRRWLYPLLAGLWLSVGVAERILAQTSLHIPWIGLLDLLRMNDTRYTETWGYLRSGPLLLYFHLFYLGLAVCFLLLGVWRWQAAHLARRPAATGLALAGAAALAAAAAAGYTRTVAAWNAAGQAAWAVTLQAMLAPPDPAAEATAVDAYDLAVDLTDPARLRVEAAVTVRNRGQVPLSIPVFSLSPDLRVTGADVAYEQEGQILRLRLPAPLGPGESRTVRLAYAGSIWAVNTGAHPAPLYFTHPQGVRLGVPAGWYPLAGRVEISTRTYSAFHAPASFRLRVAGPPGWQFASNLPPAGPGAFATPAATWAVLLGSPRLAVETHGRVTLVAGRDELPGVRRHAAQYESVLAAAGRFFPDVTYRGLTVFVQEAELFQGMVPDLPSPPQLVEVVTRDQLDRIGRDLTAGWYVEPLVDGFWRLGNGKPVTEVQKEVTRFIWRYWETGGDAAAMAERHPPDPPRISSALLEVFRRQGEEGVARVLAKMRVQADTLMQLSEAEQAAWVRAAAGLDGGGQP